MSTFEQARAATGTIRPKAGHGCPPVLIVDGVWTAHFHDIDDLAKLTAVCGDIKCVVNCAIQQCPTVQGRLDSAVIADYLSALHVHSYGDDIEVLLIDLLDDPEALKKAAAMPEAQHLIPLSHRTNPSSVIL